MTTVQITLPADLAKKAKRAGFSRPKHWKRCGGNNCGSVPVKH